MTATLPVVLAVSGSTICATTICASTIQPLAQRALQLLLEADHTVVRNPLRSLAVAGGQVDRATAAGAGQGRLALQPHPYPALQQGDARRVRGLLP